MAKNTKKDDDALKALNRIATVVGAGKAPVGAAAGVGQMVCDTYAEVKGLLRVALPLIRRIPVYGSKIAAAIQFLMTIADAYCKGGPAAAPRKAGGR